MLKNDTNLRQEHDAIRNKVGFYDFTHQLLEVTGNDIGAFLDKMFVNAIADTKVGAAKYTTMLNEEGNIIDDVIIFRMEDNKYWISTLYIEEMINWFDKHKENMQVAYENITEKTAMYAVQGPHSKEVLNGFLKDNVDNLKYLTIEDNMMDDVPVKIARCGFTGELGYEVYLHPEHKQLLEEKLNESGKEYDIKQITTDVILTSLPGEKGYALMSDLEGMDPVEAGFEWAIDWDTDFIGKDKVDQTKAEGPKRGLLGFTVEDDGAVIDEGAAVLIDGKEVGKVTKFTYGYTVEKNIGYTQIDSTQAKEGDIVKIGDVEAKLTERIFYDKENNRVRGKA